NQYTLKTTSYYIELKVESPNADNKTSNWESTTPTDFGGKASLEAYNEDISKMKKQLLSERPLAPTPGEQKRRHCWFVMLAFSPERIAMLNARKGVEFKYVESATYQGSGPLQTMTVALQPVGVDYNIERIDDEDEDQKKKKKKNPGPKKTT